MNLATPSPFTCRRLLGRDLKQVPPGLAALAVLLVLMKPPFLDVDLAAAALAALAQERPPLPPVEGRPLPPRCLAPALADAAVVAAAARLSPGAVLAVTTCMLSHADAVARATQQQQPGCFPCGPAVSEALRAAAPTATQVTQDLLRHTDVHRSAQPLSIATAARLMQHSVQQASNGGGGGGGGGDWVLPASAAERMLKLSSRCMPYVCYLINAKKGKHQVEELLPCTFVALLGASQLLARLLAAHNVRGKQPHGGGGGGGLWLTSTQGELTCNSLNMLGLCIQHASVSEEQNWPALPELVPLLASAARRPDSLIAMAAATAKHTSAAMALPGIIAQEVCGHPRFTSVLRRCPAAPARQCWLECLSSTAPGLMLSRAEAAGVGQHQGSPSSQALARRQARREWVLWDLRR